MKDIEVDEKDMKQTEAIIRAMTMEERRKPEIINGSRRKRIARGSGTSVQQVNKLLKQFAQTQMMIKQMTSLQQGKIGKKGGLKLPFLQ